MPRHTAHTPRVVVALAGRRIDPPGAAHRRFPVENAGLVAGRIRAFFGELNPQALVCSAASGADLLALEVARDLGIERHIVLPFPPEVFRKTSVTDSAGDWGERFDRVMASLSASEKMLCLNYPREEPESYTAANGEILKLARGLASSRNAVAQAVIVWNGAARGTQDNTQAFAEAARQAGLQVSEILTL